jgi:hypothetical protein
VGRDRRVHAPDPHVLAIPEVASKIGGAELTSFRLIRADVTESELASRSIDLALLFGVPRSPSLALDRLLPEMFRLLKTEGALAVWTALP